MRTICNFYHAHSWLTFTDFSPKPLEFLHFPRMAGTIDNSSGGAPSLRVCAVLLSTDCSRVGVGARMQAPVYGRPRTINLQCYFCSRANSFPSAFLA